MAGNTANATVNLFRTGISHICKLFSFESKDIRAVTSYNDDQVQYTVNFAGRRLILCFKGNRYLPDIRKGLDTNSTLKTPSMV